MYKIRLDNGENFIDLQSTQDTSQFGMKCSRSLQFRQIKNAGLFYLFSRLKLNNENMENFSIQGT